MTLTRRTRGLISRMSRCFVLALAALAIPASFSHADELSKKERKALEKEWFATASSQGGGGPLTPDRTKEWTERMEALLEKGVNINAKAPKSKQTALMTACLMGDGIALEWLLEKKANWRIAEKDGYTCLHGAGFQGRPEIAKIGIKAGMNPNDFHPDGFAPIHRASWGNDPRHAEVIKVFVDNGVDINLKSLADTKDGTDNPQLTPLNMCRTDPCRTMVKKLGGVRAGEKQTEL